MAQNFCHFIRRTRQGFSLIEISVVVVAIGALAVIGLPRFFQSLERSKAAESFKYLDSVRSAQEHYQAAHGEYTTDLTLLDIEQTTPEYFSIGEVVPGPTGSLADSWRLTLTRSGSTSSQEEYTVTFTDIGFDPENSSIATDLKPPSSW